MVAWLDPVVNDTGGASYHVDTWDGSAWVERGVLSYGLHYGEQLLELAPYLPDADGEHKVRIRQSGKEAAHVEHLALLSGGRARRHPPAAARHLGTGADVLAELRAPDRRVLDLHEAAMEVRWEGLGPGATLLALIAREEDLSERRTRPFRFPEAEDGAYQVRIDGAGGLVVDGVQDGRDGLGEPLFSAFARPQTGHPHATVSGWVKSDGQRLYAALDFAVDNTRDADADWGAIEVRTAEGWREYRVREGDATWGRVGFGETGGGRYPHKLYEWSVPLAEIGAAVGDVVEVRFSAYGTAALFEEPPPLMPIGSTDWAEPLWVPFERSLLFVEPFVWAFGVYLDEENRHEEVFRGIADWGVWESFFTRSGRKYVSYDGNKWEDPETPCNVDTWLDQVVFDSLLNLTAELRVRRSEEGGGFELRGVASDRHFSHAVLEYAPAASPNAWRPIAPASRRPVLDGVLGHWVPPGPGSFLVRLSVFDLAGNVGRAVRRISWSDTPSLTDLYVEPDRISPNGDGVADAAEIHYRVLAPVHLDFEVFNEGGQRVRTLRRDHDTVGVEATVAWDGRDDRGLPLPDGTYRIAVLGYELFVGLDTTPPEVTLAFAPPYHPTDRAACGADVTPQLVGGARDASLARLVLAEGEGATPFQWVDVGSWSVPEGEDSQAVEVSRPPAEVVGRSFRLEAFDAAGNRAAVATSLPRERLVVGRFGSHLALASGTQPPLRAVEYRDPLGVSCAVLDPIGVPPGALRFEVAETLAAVLGEVWVDWRLSGQAGWTSVRATEWTDPDGLVPRATPPDHQLGVVWRPQGVPAGETVTVRLRAVDAALREHLSNAFLVEIEGNEESIEVRGAAERPFPNLELASLVAAAVEAGALDEAADLPLWVSLASDSVFESARLWVESEDDPRYRVPVEAELVALGDRVALFRLAAWAPCTEYRGRAEGRTADGSTLDDASAFRTDCLGIGFTSTPVWASACGDPSPHRRRFTVTPNLHRDLTLQLLTVARRLPDGREDVLFSVNRPANHTAYTFELDPRDYPEGTLPFVARLTTLEGDERAVPLDVVMDVTPPEVALTFPVEGQRVCGRQFRPQGRIVDAGGFVASLELAPGLDPAPGAWRRIEPGGAPGADGELVFDPAALSCGCEAGSRRRGELFGNLGTYGDACPPVVPGSFFCLLAEEPFSGDASLRLRVFDEAGYQTCTETSFFVDGLVERPRVEANPLYLSPNGDGVLDEISALVTSEEPATVDVTVHRGFLSVDGPILEPGTVSTLAGGLSILDAVSLAWDGFDDLGARAADGTYFVVGAFRDGCENPAVEWDLVIVDTAPPAAEIVYPRTGDPLATVVEVTGTATDEHFQRWSLSVGTGVDPATWQPLGEGAGEVEEKVLGRWNTFGLAGDFVLRLLAFDRAGNVSDTRVPLRLDARVEPISDLEALPTPFSPNGDGRREEAAVRFGLSAESDVSLVVLDLADQPVRTLAGGRLAAGAGLAAWDGRGNSGQPLADGTYQVRLRAALAAQPGVTQEERVTVELDATPPRLTAVRPLPGEHLRPQGSLTGSVEDANLVAWQASLARDPAAPVWEPLDEGTRSVVERGFARLDGAADGEYVLRLAAGDAGESESELAVPFVVDGTPPAVELTAPAADALIGATPVAVLGSVEDDHLAAWWLELAPPGVDPVWTVLAAGEAAPPTPLLLWDASGVAEGPYQLRLRARDRAGNESVAAVAVAIDRSPPVAAIAAPADGAFVKAATPVAGTASDANFLDYRLEVAPGAAASGGWVEVGRGGQPVDGGLLDWKALPPDGEHSLRLVVRDRAGNQSEARVALTVDLTPPAPPAGLAAERVGHDDVRLTWAANGEGDLVGYHVLRNGQRQTAAPIAPTRFDDLDLAHGPYRYTVTAVDRAGWESAPSAPADVEVDLVGPEVRIALPGAGSAVSGRVAVRGTAYAPRDFAEYRLSVGAGDGGGGWQLLRRSPVPVSDAVLGEWDASGLADGAPYTLLLEADDLAGNRAEARVAVTVDHRPPGRPEGLTATVEGADVLLAWQPVPDDDLAGYLVYRDGVLLGGEGAEDLRALAIAETASADRARPDGTFVYQVAAIDRAGNLGPASDPAEATLESRAPRAVLVEPANGTRFDRPLFLRAVSEDRDVARVSFEWRPAGGAAWSAVGEPDPAAPFETTWDPAGLAEGDYELRAVATDAGERSDPDPATIAVTYTDVTRPGGVTALSAAVDGGEVTLAWTPADDPEVTGVHVDRVTEGGSRLRLTAEPLPAGAASFTDRDVADGDHRYEVLAIDDHGNEAEPATVAAHVYTPALAQPYTPTLATSVELAGEGAAGAAVEARRETAGGSLALPGASSGPDGRFTLAPAPLERGENAFLVRLTDADGDRSKEARVVVVGAAPPAPPTGLAAVAAGHDVTLGWDLHPEPDVLGYRPFREGEALLGDEAVDLTDAEASSEDGSFRATRAIDGSTFFGSPWFPLPNDERPWIVGRWPQPAWLTAIEIEWYEAIADYDVELWDGRAWVPVLAVRGDDRERADHELPQPYVTDRMRVTAYAPASSVGVYELRATHRPLLTERQWSETLGDGVHVYTVTAVDADGFESAPSAPAEARVGDAEAPEAVELTAAVDGARVTLTWTASAAPDLASYELFRDGAKIADHFDLGALRHEELRPAGTYGYRVRAVDAVGNAGPFSNLAEATVAGAAPAAPRDLAVAAVAAGRALDLAWAPGDAAPVFLYRVWRGEVAGGPYEPIAETAETTLRDGGLANGVTYHYVVTARDEAGNESGFSNEAAGTPGDTLPPQVPALHFPAAPGRPHEAASPPVTLVGYAERGVRVELSRGGRRTGEATARFFSSTWSRFLGTTPLELRLSPDGTATFVRTATGRFVHSWDTGALAALSAIPGTARWSGDGSRLVYPAGGAVRAWRRADGGVEDLVTLDSAVAAVPAPEGPRLAIVGSRGGASGLWLADPAAASWQLLVPGAAAAFDAASIEWSPDGGRLAYRLAGPPATIEAVDAATAARVVVEAAAAPSPPRWSPDGGALVYGTLAEGAERVLRYRFADGDVAALSPAGETARWPVWTPDGNAVAYAMASSGEVVLVPADGGGAPSLVEWISASGLEWGRSGYLLAGSGTVFYRIEPPGRVVFPGTDLTVGENVFTAVAADGAGNRSAASPPVVVRLLDDARPDLVVPEGGIVVLPAVPVAGQPARVAVTVTNRGETFADPSEAEVVASGPGGWRAVLAAAAPLPALDPGAGDVLLFDLAPPAPGAYRVDVVVDPEDAVDEADETNNRAALDVLVVGTAGPALFVDTDRASYAPGATVAIAVELANGGTEPLSGELRLRIEDLDGFLVEELPARPAALPAGSVDIEAASWPSTGVLAGDYRVVAELVDGGGARLVEAAAGFRLEAEVGLVAAVASDRALYRPGEPVRLTATVRNAAGNAVLAGLSARLTLRGPDGAAVAEWPRALPDLLPGGTASFDVEWASGGAAPGGYAVELEALRDGVAAASASGGFELAAAPAGLSGTLTVAQPAPAIGLPLTVAFTVGNGSEPRTALPLAVRLVEPAAAAEVAAQTLAVDLAAGAAFSGEAVFATGALQPRSYLVLLQAELPGPQVVTLAAVAVEPADIAPPELVDPRPSDGAFVADLEVEVGAAVVDRLSPLATVEVAVDGGPFAAATPTRPAESRWGRRVAGLAEGPHAYVVRGRDRAGNEAEIAAAFTVDRTPPAIVVAGVEDGGRYPGAVVPTVTVEEAHPAAEAEITLDGAPFVSGTPVEAAGAHLLRAIAEDLAGNRSERAVAFEIGGGAPELAAEKTAALAVDADGDGAASPGDEIAYTVTIENRGGGEATAVTLTDPLPEHTALVAGSVTSTRGSVAGSGEGGEVVVELGTLEAGGTATVELRVRVGHPLPAGVDRVVNQGVVTSAELPALPTDDPAAGGDRDATVTMVVAAPRLVAEKTAALADDADGDGAPSPGDTLEYRVVVRNAGNAAATAVAFADPVPAHTALVAGSATASQGSVVAEAPVTAELGEIAGGGASAEVRFRVVIDDPIAAGVRSLHNQGMASSAELPEVPTDDPAVDGAADPTVTAVSAAPDLVVEKTATLFADPGGDGHASPGDTLLYRVRVANRGNTAATATRLLDVLSEHLALDADSVQSSRGTVSGGAAGEPLQVEVGELAAGEEAMLSFQAAVAEPFPSDVLGVANRARVETAELPPVLSDDPATAEPGDPTVTEVFVTPRLSVGPVTIGEAEGSAVFAVALDRAGNRPVRVAWSTSDETARAGADYRADSGTLELPPGATAATIAVELVDDLADEPEETFRLLLDEVLGADADQESALATLVDDDPAPAVSVRDAAVTEGDVGESTAAVVVELATPSGFDIAVPWTTADGSALAAEDYRAASGTLAIPAGQSAGVVEIEVLADERDEPAESFFVRLGEPMAAVVGDGEAVVTIADDDPPPALLAAPASVDEPPSGGAAVAAVTVRLAAASGFEVAVSWATADGTARAGEDYVAAAGTLVFPPGTLERVATVEVLGDGRDEDDETFSLAFSGAVHAVAPAPAAVTIRDLDPPPAVSLGDGAAAEGDAASAALRLPATLSAPSGRGVRVDWTTVAGGTAEAGVDYLPGGGTLVFAPGETSAELEVSVLGDRVDERDETVFVELAAPLAATLGDGAGVGTIRDDDEARLSIADVAVDEGDEGAADALFEVRLSTESDRSVAVDYATGDGTATAGDDYTASEGRLDFPAGETRRSVAVPVLGDTLLEPDEESFTVILSSPSEAELGDAAATGTIRDDEACYGPELIVDGGAEAGTAAAWTVVEGDAWSWRGEDPAPAAGDAAFAAGETAAAELAQTVDVAAYRVRIDATPGQRFAFSARLRTGDETPPDVARVVVEYRDGDDAVVLDAFDSGELVSPFEWRRVDDVRAAPAGTGWVRVRLLARRAGDEGEADVFFDEVSLRSLRAPVLVVADAVAVEGGAGNSRATTAADFVVTLSCPYHQAVRVVYATADGTAVAGDDYVATAGTLVLAPGDTAALVSVPVVADSEHELHETFTLELSGAEPADEVVVLDAAGVGTIGNDDFCPRSPGFWKTHQELWPARELVLGGVRYGEAAMAAFLDAKGGDATLTLARQLVATRLNLLVGSDPFVLPTVAAADEFLALFPPGSNPQKGDKQAGNAIKDGLDAYNNLDCREDPVVP